MAGYAIASGGYTLETLTGDRVERNTCACGTVEYGAGKAGCSKCRGVVAPRDIRRDSTGRCAECGKPTDTKYCSDPACKREGNARVRRERYRRTNEPIRLRCAVCGKAFDTGTSMRRKYCSAECYRRGHLVHLRELRAAAPAVMAICEWCGTDFPRTMTRRYCSQFCTTAARRHKKNLSAAKRRGAS